MTNVTFESGSDRAVPATLAVLLAAGAGSRFTATALAAAAPASIDASPTSTPAASTHHKLDAELGGRPVLGWALDAVQAARQRAPHALAAAVVVTAGQLRQPLPDDVVELINPDPRRGLHSSLQLAIDHARRVGAVRLVVALGDQPGITPEAWIAVAEAGARSPIAVADYGHRRGHPVALAAAVWPLLSGAGDDGAATLMRQRPDLVRAVPCSGTPADIDTLEDLQQWHSS